MSKTVALIQARMSSSRFPGKVLEELGGLPMIVFMVQRARRAETLQDVVVVTSTDASDDPLVDTLNRYEVHSFRGDLLDVLARYAGAAESFQASEVVRLTGDCPLVDPAIVDGVVRARRNAGADYSSNVQPPTYPDGLDVECFTRGVLDRAFKEAHALVEREHVTPWMRRADIGLRCVNVRAIADCSALRLTVDYRDDLDAVRMLLGRVGRPSLEFDFFDMLRCLSMNDFISRMNPHARNEGYANSVGSVPST